MKKNVSKQQVTFNLFLSKHMINEKFINLHLELNVSKKMITAIYKQPSKLTSGQLYKLIELTGLTLEDFKPYIN